MKEETQVYRVPVDRDGSVAIVTLPIPLEPEHIRRLISWLLDVVVPVSTRDAEDE